MGFAAATAERVVVIFGGPPPEHGISCRSAAWVVGGLAEAGRDVVGVGIGLDGRWSILPGVASTAVAGEPLDPVGAEPTTNIGEALGAAAGAGDAVVVPVVHGALGEDGTLAALLDVAGVRWVGSSVVSAGVHYDKRICRRLWEGAGLPLTPWTVLDAHTVEIASDGFIGGAQDAGRLPVLPWFVKPARCGSSFGVTRVDEPARLAAAIRAAAEFGRHVLVEAAVPEARELEVAVVVGEDLFVSEVGEIVVGGDTFYDYRAKYEPGVSTVAIPAPIDAEVRREVQDLARRVVEASFLDGYARVDFLLDGVSGDVVVNEVNTVPGMTATSMFPRLLGHHGISLFELIDHLAPPPSSGRSASALGRAQASAKAWNRRG